MDELRPNVMTADATGSSGAKARPRAELKAELVRHHESSFGWALSCCGGDEAEAADVLQDAYLKVLDGRARFEGRSSFRTFLFGVIRRTALESRRRQRVRRATRWIVGHRRESHDDPIRAVQRSEEAARLRRALTGLSTRQREVLHLVFYQDMTIEAAAEVMGIAVGTARTHYERGKKQLRLALETAE